MHITTMIFGSILIAIGLIGYLGDGNQANNQATEKKVAKADDTKSTDDKKSADDEESGGKRSGTAMIPAAFGMLLMICGTLGAKQEWRKHAMHAAAGLALLGFLASGIRVAMKLGPWLAADPEVNGRAMIFLCLMLVTCAIYLGFCIYSFVRARAAGKTAKPETE